MVTDIKPPIIPQNCIEKVVRSTAWSNLQRPTAINNTFNHQEGWADWLNLVAIITTKVNGQILQSFFQNPITVMVVIDSEREMARKVSIPKS